MRAAVATNVEIKEDTVHDLARSIESIGFDDGLARAARTTRAGAPLGEIVGWRR